MRIFKSLKTALKRPEDVISLELESLDKFPKEIFEFKNLRRLSLPWIKKISTKIDKLDKLEVLKFDYGQVQLPKSVGNIKTLKELHWSAFRKGIGLELPKEIGQLENLEILNLFCSKIKFIPEEIFKLKKLRGLSIQGCDYLTELPKEIQGLENLEVLIVSMSKFIKLPFEITNLKKLKIFDFSKTPLEKQAKNKSEKTLGMLIKRLNKGNLSKIDKIKQFNEFFGYK